MAKEVLHHIEALVDSFGFFEREGQPAFEQGSARTYRAVDNRQQRASVALERVEQFEIAHRKPVKTHKSLLLDTRYGGYMPYAGMLCKVKVMQYGPGGYDGLCHAVDAESFERGGAELPQQALGGIVVGEHPVVELKGGRVGAERLPGLLHTSVLDY